MSTGINPLPRRARRPSIEHIWGDPGDIVYSPRPSNVADSATNNSFLRNIDVSLPLRRSLRLKPPIRIVEKFLAITDRELSICANLCEAIVIPHRWKIIHYPEEHYTVAARVNVIQPFCDAGPTVESEFSGRKDLPPSVRERLVWGLGRYNGPLSLLRTTLHDIDGARQFMYGYDLTDQNQTVPKLFLTDIEPIYRAKPGIM